MTLLQTKLLAVLLLVSLRTLLGLARDPRKVPLPLLCANPPAPGQGVLINESVVLEADATPLLTADLCNITMATSNKGNMILINFLTFDIGKTCDDASVEIFDYFTGDTITVPLSITPFDGVMLNGTGNIRRYSLEIPRTHWTHFQSNHGTITANGQLCGNNLDEKVFRSHTRAAYLVATPSNSTVTYPPHLDILLTSYNNGTEGKCSAEEFQCDNELCIGGDLVCNGYNECSDGSDEKGCDNPGGDTPVSAGVVIGAVIGGGVLLALIVLGIYSYLRHRKRRNYELA